MAGLIEWDKIRSTQQLVMSLEQFLREVFGEGLKEEVEKLYTWTPKGKPESFEYLRPVNVHRAAKWYVITQKLRERGYSFDLRFSVEIEEFHNLLLFAFSLDTLVRSNVVSLNNSKVRGALFDTSRFESFIYEVLVAANYASNGFNVELPDVIGSGRVDIHAVRSGVEVYAEAKRLVRNEMYIDLAVKIMRLLSEHGFSGIVDVTFKENLRTSKDIEEVVKLVENAVAGSIGAPPHRLVDIRVQELPDIIENVYEIYPPQPENIEFLVGSSYVGVFNGVFKVKEPKVLILRDPHKPERVEKRLQDKLEESLVQLKSIEADSRARKVIYVDISEVAGRPVLQLPELVKVSVSPEIIESQLEQKCREWLLKHHTIDAIVLTQNKLYLDQFGLPYALVVENKPIIAYVAPGWTIESLIVPIPHDASPEALVNLGVKMAESGNYRLAEFYYRKAIDSNPSLKEAWNNLGHLYTEFLRRPDIGLEYLEKALEIDPNYVSALINKGIALAMMGRYYEALKELERAVEINPHKHKAWYNKALIHYMLGQYSDAYKSCSKSLELKPDYNPARRLMNELSKRMR